MKQGKFIVVEGIEGVGKTSNLNLIAKFIQEADQQVIVTREPGGTPIAEALRGILLSEFDEETLGETELLLLFAGRLQHVEHVIKPALKLGKWVVCDRFCDATYAYQGAGRRIDIQRIAALHRWALGDFAPDYTILLDAPVETAFERILKLRDLDRIEKEKHSFFERVRAQYLEIANSHPERYSIIDAAKPLEEVELCIKALLKDIVLTN
ncbi:MAG: dTMP kinase [Proteobacteria bacterium]|nr:dTMP kinase [Pseudomonadota bacterium]